MEYGSARVVRLRRTLASCPGPAHLERGFLPASLLEGLRALGGLPEEAYEAVGGAPFGVSFFKGAAFDFGFFLFAMRVSARGGEVPSPRESGCARPY
jgi:hypothetical protein